MKLLKYLPTIFLIAVCSGQVFPPVGGGGGSPTGAAGGDLGSTYPNPTVLATHLSSPLPYAQGGCNSSTAWTQGSVLFAGASACAQDNANLFWDGTNHRLGIGTTAPQAKLSLGGDMLFGLIPNIGSYGKLEAVYGGTIDTLGTAASIDFYRPVNAWGNEGEIRFSTSPGQAGVATPTQRMVIDMNGNVGIGTTRPTAKLHVSQADATVGALFNGTTKGIRFNFTPTVSIIEGVDNTGTGSYQPLAIDGSTLQLFTGGSERVTIDTNGNVGIGTTSPGSNTLSIINPIATTGATRVLISLGAADSASTVTLTNAGTTKSGGYQSSDGSAGVTGSTCTAWKNGLCTSL